MKELINNDLIYINSGEFQLLEWQDGTLVDFYHTALLGLYLQLIQQEMFQKLYYSIILKGWAKPFLYLIDTE